VSRGLAGLKYSNPHFSRLRLNHTEDIRYEKLDLATQEFDLDRISFSSALASTQDDLTLSLSHTIFSEDLSNVTPDAVLDPSLDTGDVRLSFLSFTLGLDHRDNPLIPTSGYNLGTEMRLASAALGSEADYFSVLTRASWLEPIALNELRFGLASALRIGAAFPFSDTDNIPISQRYYLGGRTTIRGFRENSLGPRGANGAVIGGDLLFASNNELRYFPSDAFSVHTFLDAGTVYLQDEPILWEDLRLSTGVGFRYISPIGPIGFDIGFPLDEQRGEPSSRLHFAIGSNF
jgi:outer membrane protein insertion porin family